jgi:hypothetical protein
MIIFSLSCLSYYSGEVKVVRNITAAANGGIGAAKALVNSAQFYPTNLANGADNKLFGLMMQSRLKRLEQ